MYLSICIHVCVYEHMCVLCACVHVCTWVHKYTSAECNKNTINHPPLTTPPAGPDNIACDPINLSIGVSPPSDCMKRTFSWSGLVNPLAKLSMYFLMIGVKYPSAQAGGRDGERVSEDESEECEGA